MRPERAGAVLVDLEADRLDLLAPVEVRVDDLGVVRHDLAHLLGDGAHLHRVGSDHAELHREADRRAELEAVDAGARLRQRAVGERLLEPRLHPLARLEVLGDDDDLREVRVRQHRVEAEPEARRALADIGGVGHDVGVAGEQALGLLGGRVGDADRRAFGQPHLEEQLGARRGREELLLHQAEARDRRDEHQHRGGDDGLAPAQAELDRAAQRPIDARVVDRVGIRRARRAWRDRAAA